MNIPPRVAILGSYPEGPETTVRAEIEGRWSPWRRENSIPYQIWETARIAVTPTVRAHGYFNVYVYYGNERGGAEYVTRVDQIAAERHLIGAPGPTFDFCRDEQAHVWLHYQRITRLTRRMDMHAFHKPDGQALVQSDWLQMFRTGLIVIADPRLSGP